MDGGELRRLRKRRGITQAQLARWLNVSQPMVSQMERGERPIPSRPRPIYPGADMEIQPHDPSIREEIEEIFASAEDAELRDLFGDAPRGPYGR
jgi:transcriptional regulator with XRE-family HTH domain